MNSFEISWRILRGTPTGIHRENTTGVTGRIPSGIPRNVSSEIPKEF